MKRRNRLLIGMLCMVLLFGALALPAAANSAMKSWSGITATGAVVEGGSCPLEVEKEVLTFSITEFPPMHASAEENMTYTGSVTATYTFRNPTNYQVNTTLLFPWGRLPDYFIWGNEGDQGELYTIKVNGDEIEKKSRYSFFSGNMDSFSLDTDLPRLKDTYTEDAFFTPDLPVTIFYAEVSGIQERRFDATAAFLWSGDPSKTMVLLKDANATFSTDEGERMQIFVKNGDVVVLLVFGEVPSSLPTGSLYENASCEEKIAGQVTWREDKTETMTFEELVMAHHETESDISMVDWYNATVDSLRYSFPQSNHGVLGRVGPGLEIRTWLMAWYEYGLTVEAGETVVNSVTAPCYPSVDRGYDPPLYTYTYLLSPASTWASFGELVIRVETPFYMIEDSLGGFTKSDYVYILKTNGLPEGELRFTLSASAEPKREWNEFGLIMIFLLAVVIGTFFWLISAVVGIVIVGIVLMVTLTKKKRQDKRNE